MSSVTNRSQVDTAISTDQLIRMYRQMMAIRLFEERVNDLYTRALMPGSGSPLYR